MDIRRLLDIITENSQELRVSKIDTVRKESAVLAAARQVFGHLDLGPGITLEMALSEVNWPQSWGVFDTDQQQCLAFLLISDKSLEQAIAEYHNQLPAISQKISKLNLTSIEGVALYISPSIRGSQQILQISRALNQYCQAHNIDFVFGKAIDQLQNMEFWRRHSVPIGSQIEDTKVIHLFVLPVSERARQVFQR